MSLLVAVLVAVVVLQGCSEPQREVAVSAESSPNSPIPGSGAMAPAGESSTDTAAEVARLVNVYVSVMSQDADLIESVLVTFKGEELFTH